MLSSSDSMLSCRWIVAQYGYKTLPGTDTRRFTLTLERVTTKRPMDELAVIPTPASLDFFRLYEATKTQMGVQEVTIEENGDWQERRARLNKAKGQWRRLCLFREDFERQRQEELAQHIVARPRPSSKMRSIKQFVAIGRKRSKGSKESGAVDTIQTTSEYPGTWERKTMLRAV